MVVFLKDDMVGTCLGVEVGEVYGLGYRGCYRLHYVQRCAI